MTPTFTLRPATAADSPPIRSLVWQAKINPSGLKWPRFVVAVTPAQNGKPEQVIACGQVKPHVDGTRELASLVVAPAWRGQGIARAIIEHLLSVHPGEMYLMCLSSLAPFYEKFGFAIKADEALPAYFQRVKRSSRFIGFLMPAGEFLVVMHKGGH
jgi:amino-acid N-acetyltransferase